MSTFDTSELLATGGAFVTTLEDIKKLTASRDARIAALEAENQRLREAMEDVLRWAGKDKRRCKYTVTEMLESLNRAAAALAQPTKEEEQG